MSVERVRQAWQELASRPEIIGQEVVFDNRVGDCLDKGKISKITVNDDQVIIESSEIEAAYKANRSWSPNIRFKIDEERDPHQIGNTIFCDLDDRRQIRITAPIST